MTKKITVTKLDIKRGQPRSDDSCPIAISIKRAFNYKYNVSVSNWNAHIYNDMREKNTKFDKSIERWITAFDNGKPVKPITFKLYVF